MKVIGLTGGIGSGKSTVARAFQKIGVSAYIADDESKNILNTHPKAIEEIKDLLGESSYITSNNGSVSADKTFIASQVFNNTELLDGLNRILHPKVRIHFNEWLTKQESPYVIYEAAILFESGGDKNCDFVILVTVSEMERISRVMKRDNISEEQVRQRMNNQWSENRRLEKSDFIILNDDLEQIPVYVNKFHEFMLKQ